MTGEGVRAGRLEVLVEASLAGFRQKLKAKVDEASKGVDATVDVELDDKSAAQLKGKVKKAAEEASGADATVDVDVDQKSAAGLKAKVKAAAVAAAAGITANVDVDIDERRTKSVLKQRLARLLQDTRARIQFEVDLRNTRKDLLGQIQRTKAAMDAAFKLDPHIDLDAFRGRLSRLEGELRAFDDRVGGGGGGIVSFLFGGGRSRGRRRFGGLGPALLLGIASMIQPVVGAITAGVGGLTAMVGAMAPALNTLTAVGPGLLALAGGIGSVAIAAKGTGAALKELIAKEKILGDGGEWSAEQQKKLDEALKDLTPSARKAVTEVAGLSGAWGRLQEGVQESFFSRIVGDIRPLARKGGFLDTLRTGLMGSATVMGDLAHRGLEAANTPLFNGRLAKIMGSNNRLLASMGSWVGDATGSLFTFLDVAADSGGFVDKLGDSIERAGDRMANFFDRKAADGSLAEWLDRGQERAELVWHTVTQMSEGIYKVFKAGDKTGLDLLNRFDRFVTDWNENFDSAAYEQWFEDVKPAFLELAALGRDIGKGLADWGDDPKIAGMIKTLRTEIGPAVKGLLEVMADSSGEAFLSLLGNTLDLLNEMGPGFFAPIEVLATSLAGLVGIVHDAATVIPGGTTAIGLLLGTLVAARAATAISNLLGLTGAVGALGGKLGGLKAGGIVAGIAGIGYAFQSAKKDGASFGDYLVGAGSGALTGAIIGSVVPGIGTLVGALVGGGVGAAGGLAAAFFGAKSKAKEAAAEINAIKFAEARQHIEDLKATLDDLTGAYSDATRAAITQNLFKDGKSKAWVKSLQDAGLSLKTITDAMMGNKGAIDAVNRALDGNNAKYKTNKQTIADLDQQIRDAEQRASAKTAMGAGPSKADQDAIDKLKEKRKALADENAALKENTKATDENLGALRKSREEKQDQILANRGYIGSLKALEKTNAPLVKEIKTKGLKESLRDVTRLADKYDATPDEVVTLVKASGVDLTGRQILDLKKKYDLTPKQVETIARLMDNTKGPIDSILGRLQNLDGKTATVTTYHDEVTRRRIIEHGVRKQKEAADAITRADGGPVFGAGTSTSDSIPAWLSNGEFVVKAAAVKKYGMAFFRRLNAMRLAAGGPVGRAVAGFAKGGPVKGSPVKGSSKQSIDEAIAYAVRIFAQRMPLGTTKIRAGFKQIDRFSSRLLKLAKPLHARTVASGKAAKKFQNDGKKDGKAAKAAKARHEKDLELQKKLYKAMTDQLDKWRNRLAAVKQEQAEFRSSVRDQFKDFGSIGTVAGSMNGYASPAALITNLRRRAGQAKDYVKNLGTLLKRGLSKTLYRQLVELGPEEGGSIVTQLMAATKSQLKEISSLQSRISGSGGSLAKTSGSLLYDASIKAADAFVDRLRERARELAVLLGYRKPAKKKASKKKKKGQKRAGGGPVYGPGTSTSDSILAWLSDGEFVVKAASVAKYGLGFLQQINAGTFAAGGHAVSARATMNLVRSTRTNTVASSGHRERVGALVEKIEQNFYDNRKNAGSEVLKGLRAAEMGGLHAGV